MKRIFILLFTTIALSAFAQSDSVIEVVRKSGKVTAIQKTEIDDSVVITTVVPVGDTAKARLTLESWVLNAEETLKAINHNLSQDTLFVTNLKQVLAQRNVAVVDLTKRKKQAEKQLQKLKAILRNKL